LLIETTDLQWRKAGGELSRVAVTEKIQASYLLFFCKRFVTGVVDMSTIQKEAMFAMSK